MASDPMKEVRAVEPWQARADDCENERDQHVQRNRRCSRRAFADMLLLPGSGSEDQEDEAQVLDVVEDELQETVVFGVAGKAANHGRGRIDG